MILTFKKIFKSIIWILLFIYIFIATLFLATKYILLPNIEQFRPQIERYASNLVHGQVSINSIQTKWNNANPYIKLNEINLHNNDGKVVLRVPSFSTVVSWRSLLDLKPVFLSFEASNLLLDISRSTDNKITVMGQPLDHDKTLDIDVNHNKNENSDTSYTAINNALAWLFNQKQIVIKNSTLQWYDHTKTNKPLRLENINLNLLNTSDNHIFTLYGKPNVNKNAMLELRGQINRQEGQFNLNELQGRVYTHIKGISPKKWQPWIDWPGYFDTDNTSAQTWIELNNGVATQMIADISMANANWEINEKQQIQAENIRVYISDYNADGIKINQPKKLDLQFQAKNIKLYLNELYDSPIQINDLSSDTVLTLNEDSNLHINSENIFLQNDDIQIKAALDWHNKTTPYGTLNLSADIPYANLAGVYKYLPNNIDPDVPQWVTPALKQGIIENAKITFKGNIDDLPFEPIDIKIDSEHPSNTELEPFKSVFLVTAPFRNAILDYAPVDENEAGWPFVYDINGQLRFQGDDISVFAKSAKVAAHKNAVVDLSEIHALINDLNGDTQLTIKGNAQGNASSYFDFARVSPLSGQLDHVFDNTKASGQWDMPLTLKMPIRGEFDINIAGSINMQNTNIKFDDEIPQFNNVSGSVIFTDDVIKTQNINGQLINHAVTITGAIGAGQPGLELAGTLNAETINVLFPAPITNKIEGSTTYKAHLSGLMTNENHPPRLTVSSDLQGINLNLPAPLNKSTEQKMPLEIKWNYGKQARSRVLSIVVANIVNASFIRQATPSGNSYFDSAYVAINNKLSPPPKGMIVDITTDELDISAWVNVIDELSIDTENSDKQTIEIKDIFPSLDKLSVLTNTVYLFDTNLGTLNLVGGIDANSDKWLIEQLELNSLYMQASGNGQLKTKRANRGLELNIHATVNDLGSYFEQLGYKDVLDEGDGSITANIYWHNLPWAFNYEDLNGLVTFNLKDGRINAKKSHTVRLLELLSLQSFNRLATLDFNPKDIGKDGFAYKTLMGTLKFDNGDVTTKDYKISGPIATIVVDGLSNLSDSTLDLNAVVIPNLDVSGAAIATAIAVNPAVGLGAFITQWLLKAPLGKAMAVQYKVSGTWNEPKIESSKELKKSNEQDTN